MFLINFLFFLSLSVFAQEAIKIKPGQVVKLTMPAIDSFFPIKAFCGEDSIFFEKDSEKKIYFFYFAPSYFSNPGVKITCGFSDKAKQEKIVSQFEIIDGGFPEEKLSVDPSKVHFTKKALKHIAADRKLLNKVYHAAHYSPFFKDEFVAPMDTVITSEYGGRRLFNGHKASQHLGIDYRATVGSPVKASNSGKVVLSGDLFFTGNTVIIDHGLGIFSMYGHLSKLIAKTGEMVTKGDVIAHSGATGRVSGPHLHFGVKMNHNWIHPLSLMEASK